MFVFGKEGQVVIISEATLAKSEANSTLSSCAHRIGHSSAPSAARRFLLVLS